MLCISLENVLRALRGRVTARAAAPPESAEAPVPSAVPPATPEVRRQRNLRPLPKLRATSGWQAYEHPVPLEGLATLGGKNWYQEWFLYEARNLVQEDPLPSSVENKEKDKCVYCLEDLFSKELVMLSCGHMFHKECFVEGSGCPMRCSLKFSMASRRFGVQNYLRALKGNPAGRISVL
eukprot:TRINITY_DN14768_c0_g1_i1.p1 TRINITY_DN14768_c0_g1~~TRINITY_DN14768_c0_g1_i1.p1  ORF type:complete len:202 (-),score=31.79 TRINITY_DN14768_c0_g1_i1:42-578(-)